MKKHTIFLGIAAILPSVAHANVIWPAMLAEDRITSLPIIALSLGVEFVFFRWFFALDVVTAWKYTLAANFVSGIAGFFLRPLAPLLYEWKFEPLLHALTGWGTFNPLAWCLVPILGGAINAALELWTIRRVWARQCTLRAFALTSAINALTVGMGTVWVIVDPPQ